MNETTMENPTPIEVREAENMLTPEQKVASEARFEVLKHKASFLKAGVSKEQIENSSVFAAKKAMEERKELIAQNPWNAVSTIIAEVTKTLDENDQNLMLKHLSWASELPSSWKNKVELRRYQFKMDDPSIDIRQVMEKMFRNNDGVSSHEGNFYVSQDIATTKARHVIEDELNHNDPGGREIIQLSPESVLKLLEAFGAEIPTVAGKIVAGEYDHIKTKLPGISISAYLKKAWQSISLNYSSEVLEKIISLPQDKQESGYV